MTKMNDHSRRAHALLSASSSDRWLNCPPSAVAVEMYPQQDTEFTREGTKAHEVAELVAKGIDPEDVWTTAQQVGDSSLTREMIECAIGYRDYIQEQTKSADAIIMLERRVDFSPWVPQGFGTCDCIIMQDRVLSIIDYKYGQGVSVSAEGNPQMKLYALGALNDYGILMDVDRVEMHIYQPRLNNISVDSLTLDELMEWAVKTVKPTAAKAIKGKGDYSAGAWCKFCAHAGRCRALTKVCTEYVETHSLRVAVPVLAPHEVAEVLAMEPLVKLWLKRVTSQAQTSLLNGEEIPGFKVVEGKLGNRKWSDEQRVAETLHEAGYKDDEITETKLLSPASMDKSIGKKKVAELLGELIDRSPGAPTVVSASDKRPALNRLAEAKNDFEVMED